MGQGSQQNFLEKGQIINICSFMSHVANTQLHCYSTIAATDYMDLLMSIFALYTVDLFLSIFLP